MGAVDWRVKIGVAVCMFVIAGFDMTFSTATASAGVLMLISILVAGEALSDRDREMGGGD